MSTNELEIKLKIIKDTAINCSTLELAKQVLNILHQLGLTWCDGNNYIKYTDWDTYKENTIYHPFEGRFSSLAHAQEINCEIISAEEFITLHTEEFNLENYEPKGQLIGFPKEIIARMLNCQEEQGTKRDVTVFEKYKPCSSGTGGFDWDKTEEKSYFWHKVINNKNFNVFFEKYPKQDNKDNSQEFNLENYVPKGQLKGFPKEVIKRMLDCQEEQDNKRDISVFEERVSAGCIYKGFDWDRPKEGSNFWYEVIIKKDFNLFFKKYPKKDNWDNSQKFNLENYVPKGQLTGFPKEIIAKMLDYQEEQGNKKDISVFEKSKFSPLEVGGFAWNRTKEKDIFWYEVISCENFNLFFEKYPKQNNQDNSQEFKVGDKVIDIIRGRIGKVIGINTLNKDSYPIFVDFDDKQTAAFTLDGKYCSIDKYPRLLHYRDDYNYDIIDFNNLPQRQKPKRGLLFCFT